MFLYLPSVGVTISECDPAEGRSLPCCTGQSSPLETIPTHPFCACACVLTASLSSVWILAHQDCKDSSLLGSADSGMWYYILLPSKVYRGEGFLMKCYIAELVAKWSCTGTCPTSNREWFRAKINHLWFNKKQQQWQNPQKNRRSAISSCFLIRLPRVKATFSGFSPMFFNQAALSRRLEGGFTTPGCIWEQLEPLKPLHCFEEG